MGKATEKNQKRIMFVHLGTVHDDALDIAFHLSKKGVDVMFYSLLEGRLSNLSQMLLSKQNDEPAKYVHRDLNNVDWESFSVVDLRNCRGYHLPDKVHIFGGYLRQLRSRLRASIDSGETLVTNSVEMFTWIMEKAKYLKRLETRDVRIMPTIFVKRYDPNFTLSDHLEELYDRGDESGVVLKPSIGSKAYKVHRAYLSHKVDGRCIYKVLIPRESRGVTDFEQNPVASETFDKVQLDDWFNKVYRNDDLDMDVLIQPYFTSDEYSIIFIDGKPSHFIEKTPNPAAARVGLAIRHEHFGGINTAVDQIDPEILEMAHRTLAAVPQNKQYKYVRIDLMLDGDGRPCVLEVEGGDPRMHLVESGKLPVYVDLLHSMVEQAQGRRVENRDISRFLGQPDRGESLGAPRVVARGLLTEGSRRVASSHGRLTDQALNRLMRDFEDNGDTGSGRGSLPVNVDRGLQRFVEDRKRGTPRELAGA